ncbi:MAG: hypothetical protein Q6360_01160 [Candidatus Brocadiales bacterium]|nr:hypothetical protein [Candidatus Brocadiales bacterium]
MEIDFLAPAKAEFKDAISHYNLQSEGLGFEFAAEVKRTWSGLFNTPKRGFLYRSEPVVVERTDFLMESFIKLEVKQFLL